MHVRRGSDPQCPGGATGNPLAQAFADPMRSTLDDVTALPTLRRHTGLPRPTAAACLGVLAVGLVALGGCARSTPIYPVPQPQDPTVVAPTVLRLGYDRIADIYYEERPLAALTESGLNNLDTIDPDLSVEVLGAELQILHQGQEVARTPLPDGRSPAAWTRVVMDTVAFGRRESPALATADANAIYAAVFDGMLDPLDSYSRYVGPERAEQERAQRDGYGGIGLLMEYDPEERALVQQVFDDGPARAAGIKVGSYIVSVNGEPVAGWPIERLGATLRGPVDTIVRVGFEEPDGTLVEYRFTRAKVIPTVVEAAARDGIGIIRLARFNAAATADVADALQDAIERNGGPVAGLVLDLRGNPGGLLDEAVAVADLFLTKGEIIHTRGRHPDSLQQFNASPTDITDGLPMVVLLDGRSASGAEVVAAALQDAGRAVVVGASSFGKGSVQTVTRLPNDGELYLTWSRIFSAGGYTLNEQGVMPTLCTSGTIQDADALVAGFQLGELPVPASMIDLRRAAPEDRVALDALRESCPWRVHDEALDLNVALRLLAEPALYRSAIAAALPPGAAPSVAATAAE